MPSDSGSTGDIQAVQRVARLLALFTVNRPQVTVAEAAAEVGLNRTTVSRYFGSLLQADIVERSPDEPTAYQPGRLLLQLGAVAQGQRRVLDIAPRHMRSLSKEAGLTVVLSLLGSDGPVVSLVTEVGTFPILVTVRVGTLLNMDSAQGHLFLRFSEQSEIAAAYYETLDTGRRRRIKKDVDACGRRGIARASTEHLSVSVMAAPVFDEHDISATIALVGTMRSLPEDAPDKERALVRTAYAITEEMGGLDVWRASLPAPGNEPRDR